MKHISQLSKKTSTLQEAPKTAQFAKCCSLAGGQMDGSTCYLDSSGNMILEICAAIKGTPFDWV